ncbi:hypothetical protein D3C75_825260 [compost metagenome]
MSDMLAPVMRDAFLLHSGYRSLKDLGSLHSGTDGLKCLLPAAAYSRKMLLHPRGRLTKYNRSAGIPPVSVQLQTQVKADLIAGLYDAEVILDQRQSAARTRTNRRHRGCASGLHYGKPVMVRQIFFMDPCGNQID